MSDAFILLFQHMTSCSFVLADFLQSLESLNGDELLRMMQSFLSKGIAAGQKGFERVANEAKISHEEKNLLEEENRKLHEENEKLKNQTRQLVRQVQTLT
jgi:sensor histidine kinase YesM